MGEHPRGPVSSRLWLSEGRTITTTMDLAVIEARAAAAEIENKLDSLKLDVTKER